MTDFLHTETAGASGTAFSSWWNGTVPATVPVGDTYIFQIGTQNLDEHPGMSGKQIDGNILIRPVPGEGHTGVRETGREIRRRSNDSTQVFTHSCTGTGAITIEDMEINTPIGATASSGRIFSPASNNTVGVITRRCLITNGNASLSRPLVASGGTGDFVLVSSRFYQEVANAGARYVFGFYDGTIPRNLVFQGNVFQSSAGDIQRGIALEFGANSLVTSVFDVQGNIVLGTTEDYEILNFGNGKVEFLENVSEDLTGQVTGATLAADLDSFDNPDVKEGSIALIIWSAKSTAFGAQLDIRGNNRTTVAGTADWDAGSMQFSSSAVASDINLSPTGATLLTAAFNDVVDLRHPLTLIPEDSGALQIMRTGVAVPVVQGADIDIVFNVLSDQEEDGLFPVFAGDTLTLLLDAAGEVSLAPIGARMLPLGAGDNLSLSFVDSDKEFDEALGVQFSAVIGAGAPSFLIEDNDAILFPVSATLQVLSDGAPNISISIPLDLEDNPDIGAWYFTEFGSKRNS